jgi:hypothetical protein
MIVKLIVRINQAERASIFTGTFPNIIVPEKKTSYGEPRSAFTATILLINPIRITVASVIIPLPFVLKDRIAMMVANNMTNKAFINSRTLKPYQ